MPRIPCAATGRLEGFSGYVAQEKLDGVFTLWTGRRLVTKAGHAVHTHLPAVCVPIMVPMGFSNLLPPFPFVAELYLGTNTLTSAVRLVNAGPGDPLWAHARLVAFDVPGCEPHKDWTYEARYALLRHVVAAWNSRFLSDERMDVHGLPLQVIASFPMLGFSTHPQHPRPTAQTLRA